MRRFLPIYSLLLGVVTVLASGCQSTSWDQAKVDDGLLAYVPEGQQEDIAEARQRRAELGEQLAGARRDLAQIESHLALAERDLGTLEMRLTEVNERADHARRFGSNEDFEAAQRERDEVQAALRLARTKISYYEDLEQLASRRIDLLQRRVELADSRVELAKARAVAGVDRPVAETIDVDKHRHKVRDIANRVEEARIEALVARERVKLTSDFVDLCSEDVPESLRFHPIEPVAKVLRSNAYEDERDKLGDDEMAPAKRHDTTSNGNGNGNADGQHDQRDRK